MYSLTNKLTDSLDKLLEDYRKVNHHAIGDEGVGRLNTKATSASRKGYTHKPLMAPAFTVVLHGWLMLCETVLDNIAIMMMPERYTLSYVGLLCNLLF